MGDSTVDISYLRQKVENFVQERDWTKYHHPKELAISITLEAAELLELFQWKEKEDLSQLKKNPELIQKMKEELADIMIYCINLANRTDIDISEAILEKLSKNEEKYPISLVKGKSNKYSDYVK
jgi:dCTP diphosphatase